MVGTPLPLITGLLKDGSTKRQYKMYLNREVVIGKDLLAGAYGQKYPNLGTLLNNARRRRSQPLQ